MREEVGTSLGPLMRTYGAALWEEPDRLSAVLEAQFPDAKTEIHYLVGLAKLGIPQRLKTEALAGGNTDELLRNCQTQAIEELNYPPAIAAWAITAWATALSDYLAWQYNNRAHSGDTETGKRRGQAQFLHRLAQAYWQHFKEGFQLIALRVRERGWFYGIFIVYTFLFAVFVSGLIGFLFGYIFGATVAYFLKLNIYMGFQIGGGIFMMLFIFMGLYGLIADFSRWDVLSS